MRTARSQQRVEHQGDVEPVVEREGGVRLCEEGEGREGGRVGGWVSGRDLCIYFRTLQVCLRGGRDVYDLVRGWTYHKLTIFPAVPVAFFATMPGLTPTSWATFRSSGHRLVNCDMWWRVTCMSDIRFGNSMAHKLE